MDKPIDTLRVKVALDTQILAYLTDNTYPHLTSFIYALSSNKFVDLVCSRFAIYEFIGIRKLEHYLRTLVKKSEDLGGKVNFSSALKFKNDYNSPELKYIDVYEDIKSLVEKELSNIQSKFNIIHETVSIHDKVWKPHQDLVLSTKISKEDSLLLISSIFPDILKREEYLVLFTNDSQFHQSLTEDKELIEDKVFSVNGLKTPHSYNLKKIHTEDNTAINLVNYNSHLKVNYIFDFSNKFIFEHIKNKNQSIVIGETINCACNKQLKRNLLCFRLKNDHKLTDNMYLSILTKDFRLYNHKVKISEFQNQGKKISFPYSGDNDPKSKEISLKLLDIDGNSIDEEVMNNITTEGNLVFVHPDNDI